MREQLVRSIMDLAEKDDRVMLLTGDLGFGFVEKFQEKFPNQFINCGIAEQNMIGVSAGLSMCGKIPFIYSTIPFITMRCYEQIRDDLCYNGNKAILLGIGGSHYNFLGFSHNAYNDEDVKIMKLLPNMRVYTPYTKRKIDKAIKNAYNKSSNAYIKI